MHHIMTSTLLLRSQRQPMYDQVLSIPHNSPNCNYSYVDLANRLRPLEVTGVSTSVPMILEPRRTHSRLPLSYYPTSWERVGVTDLLCYYAHLNEKSEGACCVGFAVHLLRCMRPVCALCAPPIRLGFNSVFPRLTLLDPRA